MTSDESEFNTALNRGRVYDCAAQLRTAPQGTPITDATGRHWIRGFNDPTERRWRRRKAPRLIWVGIGGDQDRCPSSEIPLPARHTTTEAFWALDGLPTTLLETSQTPFSIGAIAGGWVGGTVDSAQWDQANTATRDYWLGLGLSPVPAIPVAGGSVGGTPAASLWDTTHARSRNVWADTGESNTDRLGI
ncbi:MULTISPECIES: hypothetical protein [Rhodococcus]|jgi:hypothetical protein|uniref:hypothetical protein n=1 Tax=Rhodococcus TaxID=1827 RepID=UPI0006427134|nr:MULTISPECIES: hypothetical protein [Rhodococcus]KLN73047.1 hypothetical protein ABM90_04260 [Rhodococcus erythropolis]AZI65465.1 hypothetical protein EHW12_30555 [Rhodococcus sp. NJ-530]KSU66854.1 hypothetical protein AS032_31865 [Rhodococcus qingshengii]KZF15177.1 hypothetical protein A2J01_32170 [Rhodococcus sp. EPR-134]MDJ0440217.1 hypothetical protein [Rhodococcus qingshengii]